MHPVRVPVISLSVASVAFLPGGIRGEDGLHRLGPALSFPGQRPVHAYWYGEGKLCVEQRVFLSVPPVSLLVLLYRQLLHERFGGGGPDWQSCSWFPV